MAQEKISFTMSTLSPSEKKQSKSITDISPTASNTQIIGLARALNNLTGNTLGSVTRIEQSTLTSVDYLTAQPDFSKSNDTNNAITIDGTNITISNSKLVDTTDLTNMAKLTLTCRYLNNQQYINTDTASITWQQPEYGYYFVILNARIQEQPNNLNYVVFISPTETENFKPMTIYATLRFETVTINEETRYINPLTITINVEE